MDRYSTRHLFAVALALLCPSLDACSTSNIQGSVNCQQHSNCSHIQIGTTSNPGTPQSGIAGMSGGCKPFAAIAQNRYPPYGAAIRTQPNHLATQVGSYAGNKTISVNGWVYGTADYPSNPPPWNSNKWFHLTDGAGWVAFAAVRAYPMAPDPEGLNPDGGPPVATPASCEGAVQ